MEGEFPADDDNQSSSSDGVTVLASNVDRNRIRFHETTSPNNNDNPELTAAVTDATNNMLSLSSVLPPDYRDILLLCLKGLSKDPTHQRVQFLRVVIDEIAAVIPNNAAFSGLVTSALASIDTLIRFPFEPWATPLYRGVALERGEVAQERELALVDSDVTFRMTGTTDESTVSGDASRGGASA